MVPIREFLKQHLPSVAREFLEGVRSDLWGPAGEDVAQFQFRPAPDSETRPRLSLVMPSIDPAWAFGGVTTAIDIFLDLCLRTGADARIITEGGADRDVVAKRLSGRNVNLEYVEHVKRPPGSNRPVSFVPVRSSDLFITYNWAATLNIRDILDYQVSEYGGSSRPFIYLIQDYEPSFFPFSSAHMLARLALDQPRRCWGLFNSSQLKEFVSAQGHKLERAYVFEPKIGDALRPALEAPPIEKRKRILVYGRPTIPRNCFPAVEKGLRLWAELYPRFSEWDVVSAGMAHKPLPLGDGRSMRSLGKLSLEGYADLMRTTGVGLSLMASPHPSYPPLEMAHFGLLTITNEYANKNLAAAHDNFLSIPDIDAPTIAAALAEACDRFEAAPDVGWKGRSHLPSYIDPRPWAFLDELSADLDAVWEEIRDSSLSMERA
jgi:hypothetical protein